MTKRNVIEIDQEKCTGCGQCAATCHQGAIAMVDGKAKLVRGDYCDGLGRCLGACPADAITIIEVDEVAPTTPNPTAQPAVPLAMATPAVHGHAAGGGCPGHRAMSFQRPRVASPSTGGRAASELEGWPIQLHLIRPEATMFHGADVLIAASCSAFACGAFHADLLRGKKLIIACPKLDRQEGYLEKLTALFLASRPTSVTVARMEVPCCTGLTRLVATARDAAETDTPLFEVVLSLQGEIIQERELTAVVA